MTMRFQASILVVLFSLLLAPAVDAEEPELPDTTQEGYMTGWHIVRPDDTLEDITLQYLGTQKYWEENWHLNREGVQNPDLIFPGQRLQVIVKVGEAVPTAQLSRLAGKVEERPVPIPWREAGEKDILLERDGIQTFAKSSTELEFQDGTRVTLTENSTVFVRRAGVELIGQERKSVEILEGQADIQAELPAGSLAEVEVVVGGSVATAKASDRGETQARARKVDQDNSAFMVYAGEAQVASAGQSVPLAAGMGTAVAKGAPPRPPEKLLPAPAVTGPLDGTEIEYGVPEFAWVSVEDAESYVLEICRDAGCGELVERVVGLQGTSYKPAELETGEMYWRVAPVSATGLDGFSSPPTRFASLGRVEGTPPEVGLALVGRKVRVGDRVIGTKDLEVVVALEDADSGPGRYETFLNGEAVANSRLEGGWTDGDYHAAIVGFDAAGNSTEASADFEIDAEPPVIEWRMAGAKILANLGSGYEAASDGHRLEWTVDGKRWRRVRPGGSTGEGAAATIRSDHPFVLIRAIEDGAFGDGSPVELARGEAILIAATDRRSGTALLELRVDETGAGGPRLLVVATDHLGNQATESWPLVE